MADDTIHLTRPIANVDEIQQGWHELKLRVGQLEAEKEAIERENKNLRFLLERVIEHRQKSHAELVLILSGLVSKLPLSDVGVIVSRLVEHNTHVNEMCAALTKSTPDTPLPQPAILKALDQAKRDLAAAATSAAEELIQSGTPLEADSLRAMVAKPELFFSPAVVRANRCLIKGQVPRERIVREFGEPALAFFNDLTTDPKLNPRPKPDEIVLGFKPEFAALVAADATLSPEKREALVELNRRVQTGRATGEAARAQKNAFLKLSFTLDLLHYYEHQSTEPVDSVFAQRLPVLIEQLVVAGPEDGLDEKLVCLAESWLGFILNADHRLMVINNIGKAGGAAKTLKFVLRLRSEKAGATNPIVQTEVAPEFVRHLVPPKKAPPPPVLAALLRLLPTDLQKLVVRAVYATDRLRKDEADALGKAVAKELGLGTIEAETQAHESLNVEMERLRAWGNIKELIARRTDPATVAASVRERLHVKYDADEIRQSWITLTESDPMSFIRVFCQLPYLPDGRTDTVARAVLETYISRLMHQKYAAVYTKVLTSLKNMFRTKPDSPTLVNFLALIRWVDADAARRLATDIGMPAA